jgi:hypothetical protein
MLDTGQFFYTLRNPEGAPARTEFEANVVRPQELFKKAYRVTR